jgi:hypothetical protein
MRPMPLGQLRGRGRHSEGIIYPAYGLVHDLF